MKNEHINGVRLRGNTTKYAAYRYAFQLIKKSMEVGCFLQAITIEESLLCDRLFSVLLIGKEDKRREILTKATLGVALREWEDGRDTPESVRNSLNALLGIKTAFSAKCREKCFDLTKIGPDSGNTMREKLNVWWRYRCALLHGLVTSTRGEGPRFSPVEFETLADKVAKIGLKNVRIVDLATKKCIKEFLMKGTNK